MIDIADVRREFTKEFMGGKVFDTPEGRFEIDEVFLGPDGLGGFILDILAYSDEPSEALDFEIRECIPNPYEYAGWSVSTEVCLVTDRAELQAI